MAEVKDKIITVESLKALHDYNQSAYMPIDTTAEDIGVYTKEQVYNKEEVYTKEEVYNKEQVYTKEEVDAAIRAAIESITNSGSDTDPDNGSDAGSET